MWNTDRARGTPDFLTGGGEMAARLRAHDWAATAMGPMADWPVEVKAVLAMMLQSPLPMIALFGEVGTMIYNDAYSLFAGARHPELLGSEVRQGWPEVADFNDLVIKTVLGTGKTLSFKNQVLTLDRGEGPKQVWLDLDYSPLVDVQGRRLGVIAIVVETTDRVMADRSLQNERMRLRQMYEQSPSFMALLEGPEHRFVLANESCLNLVGHRDILGKTVAEALPETVAQNYVALLDRVFASGEPYRSSLSTYDMQLEPGGQSVKRYVDFVFQPISDANGTITSIFVDGIDITDRVAAQEAIATSEARFRTFAEVMPDQVWTAQPDGRLDWLNQRVCDYCGKAMETLLDAGWIEVVHPEDRTAAEGLWGAALTHGQAYETEFRILSGSGAYRWHLVRAYPIRDERGAIVQWIGTNTDIHAQKQAEAETTRDRDRLWAMSQDLMLVCDFHGVITAVNPTGKRLLGWDEGEMIGRPLQDFVHPEEAGQFSAQLARLSGGARSLAFENRYRGKDGSFRLFDWTAVSDEGRIHGVGRDITDYRRLARDRERIWTISPVVKVVMQFDGVILDVNPSWTKVLGWLPEETIRHSIFEFLMPEERARAATNLAALRGMTGMMSTESWYQAKSGATRRIAWSILPDSGAIYGFGRDITAETEAAAALASSQSALRQAQKMEAIGQLTGGVAHDFNNLLQVVSSNLQLLTKEVAGNDRAERRIGSAMEAVAGGARLASQLLAFGRRQPLAPKVLNLGRLIRNMDDILRRALGEAVEIETIVAGGLWNTLVDPGNVENALLNLAINGRDAMEGQGNLTIELGNAHLDDSYASTAYDVAPGQYVMLAVTDTGTGIAPELLEKVFEPFFTTKPEGRGTGLGLSMVYGFVKQSGGHVQIYSELGQGTTIKIYLPRSLQPEEQVSVPASGPIQGGSETILVAEDDARVRESVIETLSDLGYRVLQAGDAQSALAILESGLAIDLLFTDVVMPGRLKSADLARLAVERLPGLKVLFTSGYTENSIVHGGILDPGVELLSKPYSREALARKVRQLLSAASPAPSPAAPPVAVPADSPLRLLLCEDDALIRLGTVDLLEDMGHKVIATATARAALEALEAHQIDMLITDLGLPDMDGTRLVQQVRQRFPLLPVIFATGHAEVEGFPRDLQTEILEKPYNSAGMTAAVQRLRRD